MGTLYYGDNLDILRRYLKDETVDLVYLDPPFNSAQTYNAFFHEKDGTDAASQIRAFEDTWHWDIETKAAYDQITEQPGKVSDVMQAFYQFLGGNDMMAYITMMAPRLVELRRVLKPSGSLYLHCDPTASHYLKLLCDAVFGQVNFRTEVIWKRTSAHNDPNKYGNVHDTIFFYTRGDCFTWNVQYTDYDQSYIEAEFRPDESGRPVKYENLTGAGKTRGTSGQPWRGVDPSASGRHWAIPRRVLKQFSIDGEGLTTQEKLEKLLAVGRIKMDASGRPLMRGLKTYLEELPGTPLQSVWTDVDKVGNTAKERLGYPTQKPLALLERIINASSNPGDLVLDPFCGCGTTIDAAEKLGREWIGIDITPLAITLIKSRLCHMYEDRVKFLRPSDPEPARDPSHTVHPIFVRVIGEPVTPADAAQLADDDKWHFQLWALGLVGARPVEQKKGADHGIDGKILFRDDPESAKPEQIIIQVKGGKTGVKDVRDLRGVIDREKAAIGILISLQPATGPMESEAASMGFYEHKLTRKKYPRLQLRTVKELMEGKGIERPSEAAAVDMTFKKAPESKKKQGHQKDLGL